MEDGVHHTPTTNIERQASQASDDTLRAANRKPVVYPTVFDVFDQLKEERNGGDEGPGPTSNGESSPPPAPANTTLPPSALNGETRRASPPPPPLPPAPFTAGTAFPVKPPHLHQRNVSWGMNNVFGPEQMGSASAIGTSTGGSSVCSQPGLQQPDLMNVDSDSELTSSIKQMTAPPRPPPISMRGRKYSRDGRLDLEDISKYNPIESEAETYIIRALEQREPSSRSRLNSTSMDPAPVLANIPDEAIKSLSSADEDKTADDHSSTGAGPFESSGGVPLGSNTPSTTQASRAQARMNRHRRNQTMEEKLFDLTAALGAIHGMHSEDTQAPFAGATPSQTGSAAPAEPARERLDTFDSVVGTGDYRPSAEPISSASAFQKNASILYNRNKKDDASGPAPASPKLYQDESYHSQQSSGSADTTGSERWRRLQNIVHAGVLHPKKTDEIIQEDTAEDAVEDSDLENGKAPATPQGTIPGTNGDGEDNNKTGFPPTSAPPEGIQPNALLKFKTEFKIFKDFEEFFSPRSETITFYLKAFFLYFLVPTLGIACILFYLAGNPPTGKVDRVASVNGTYVNQSGEPIDPNRASASWWLVFVVRQSITFALAKAAELLVIDFLLIRNKTTAQFLGPWPTLFIMQSRGWPFLAFMWGILDFALLSGTRPFFSHWAYWQHLIDLFNETNPSGGVVYSKWNFRVLSIAVTVGVVVAAKRFWLGLSLGRKTFVQFSDQLAAVMKKILLVSEVASLAKECERYRLVNGKNMVPLFKAGDDRLSRIMESAQDDEPTIARSEKSGLYDANSYIIDPDDRHPLTGSLSAAQKSKIIQLLGDWEEPVMAEKVQERVSVNAILQFRRALAFLKTDFPFSGGFGHAGTREDTIESAQEVYQRLLLRTPDEDVLSFEVLALLGLRKDGSLDQDKLRDMIRLFRPDREGNLNVVDFVKSIDSVYREIRTLRAAVTNSSKIDFAFENILNIFFYTVVVTIILSQIGYNPFALFLSISGVVLAFAFMISTASSKYFEGLLFILVRRPYNIGDGIHISNPQDDTSYYGSAWWLVEDVTLFTTSVVFLFTGERATLSNGSLANSRIINAHRSNAAWLFFTLKFPIDVPYEKLKLFQEALEQFVSNRPREWLSLASFRASNVVADLGYIEYIVVVNHRESWNSWLAIQTSKADLMVFSLELAKKLDIRYKSPPLPVDLSMVNSANNPFLDLNTSSSGNNAQFSPSAGRQGYSLDLSALQTKFLPRGTS